MLNPRLQRLSLFAGIALLCVACSTPTAQQPTSPIQPPTNAPAATNAPVATNAPAATNEPQPSSVAAATAAIVPQAAQGENGADACDWQWR